MAQFFRGQRVRIVGARRLKELVGKEATILSFKPDAFHPPTGDRWSGYNLDVDGVGNVFNGFNICLSEHFLAPLTDPFAERFIESIKKLGREPINDAPKVTV